MKDENCSKALSPVVAGITFKNVKCFSSSFIDSMALLEWKCFGSRHLACFMIMEPNGLQKLKTLFLKLRNFCISHNQSASYFFFLYWSPFLYLCVGFDTEVLSINLSANVFVFGDFSVHHEDWLTYSGGTDRPDELCYNFSISNDLTQMVNFPTLTVLLFWIDLFLLTLVFVLQLPSLHWEILIMFIMFWLILLLHWWR